MAWVAILTGLLGAGASVGGAALSRPRVPRRRQNINTRDPMLNALTVEAMQQLGLPIDEGLLRQAGPITSQTRGHGRVHSLLNAVQEGQRLGLSASDITNELMRTKREQRQGGPLESVVNGQHLRRAVRRSGYGSLQDWINAEMSYQNAIPGRLQTANQNQEEIAAARRSAQERIAALQAGFVAPTEQQITDRSTSMENVLRAQIAREFDDRDKAALYQANAYGINPAGQMGRLGEGRALANLAAGPDALARTLQLLGGEQALQQNALGVLQSSLNNGTNNALNLLGFNAGQNAFAANQSLALAQLQSQSNQLMGQGVMNAGQQLAAIPGLISERQRQNRIDQMYGLAPNPGNP
jgi:hypothetical protein